MIPVKNQATSLRSAVNAVSNQSIKPKEIIVVDGHSSDNVEDAISGFPVKLLEEDFGTRGGALEVGLECVTSEFVAFTDADCIPQRDWLEKLIPYFTEGVVGVGGTVLNSGDSEAIRIVNAAFSSPFGSGQSVQGRVYSSSRKVRSISGSNSMYRVCDLLQCGGFDVHLKGAEDAELNHRIRELGDLVLSPQSVVMHFHGRGYNSFLKRMFHYGKVRVATGIPSAGILIAMVAPLIMLIALIASPYLLAILLLLYAVVLLIEGIRITYTSGLPLRGCLLVPAVLILEHFLYSIGVWLGIVAAITRAISRIARA